MTEKDEHGWNINIFSLILFCVGTTFGMADYVWLLLNVMTFDLNNLWVQQYDKANVCLPCGIHAGAGWTSTRGVALRALYTVQTKN